MGGENTQVSYDEDTRLEGAKKRKRRPGSYGSLEFVFHKDYPIGVEGVDECICLRVLRSRKILKEEDHRIEIVRKELRNDRYVAIYRGHPNFDSAQLRFVDERKLFEAIAQAKADMAYDQHNKEQRRKKGRPRRKRRAPKKLGRIEVPDSVRKMVLTEPQAPKRATQPRRRQPLALRPGVLTREFLAKTIRAHSDTLDAVIQRFL